MSRPVILIFLGYYLPGYKGGGPTRSVANLVSALRGDFDFRIVTSDRDLGDREAYAGIVADQWQEVGEAKVFYLSPGLGKWARIAKLVRAADFDLIYLNSFFSRPFSMFPLLVWAIGCRPLGASFPLAR